jgi:hypothetical protein
MSTRFPVALLIPLLAWALPAHTLKIEKKQDLNFGTLVPGDGPGAFGLSPSGAPKAERVSMGAGLPSTAVFHLVGPPSQPFRVKLPDSVPTDRRTATLWVDTFQAGVAGGDLVFDGNGKAELRVGGTLHLPLGVPMGHLALPPVELILECADASVTTTFHLRGRLIVPIRVEAVGGPMDFGKILSPVKDTQVLLDPAGGRKVLLGGSPTILVGTTPSRAGGFQVWGEPEERVSLVLPAEAELQGPHGVMKIVQFRSDMPSAGGVLTGGRAMVRVGATLLVQAGQPAGLYQGYYTVVFDYQ